MAVNSYSLFAVKARLPAAVDRCAVGKDRLEPWRLAHPLPEGFWAWFPARGRIAMRQAMEFAGRLHDDAGGIVVGQSSSEMLEAGRVVGRDELLAERVEMDVAPRFAGIVSDGLAPWRLAETVPCLACGTCSPSSVQAKRQTADGSSSSTPRAKGGTLPSV